MAQGKQGIWMFIFPDLGETQRICQITENMLTWWIYLEQKKVFKF